MRKHKLSAIILAGSMAGFLQNTYAENKSMEELLKAPANVAAAPSEAEKTASGLASIVLEKGTGSKKPTASDQVEVHYTGWTTDGKMFDSSVQRGETATFPLGGVIKGWTEGLQLMVEGEKRRFWIPEDLAYGPAVEGSGRPGGLLVFDVELVKVVEIPKLEIPADALKTKSGLSYVITAKGEDEKPKADSLINFHFTFFSPEGQPVQSSKQAGQPQLAPLDKLPPFFSEVFAELGKGGKAEVYIPGEMLQAPLEMVKSELELIDFRAPAPAPEVPADVAAVPSDAVKTESGLASRVLKAGSGKKHPSATDVVEVNYTGWETDGKMFDSSITRGQTAEFPLNKVIKGWTEGVQLMVEGETRRFWIPAELAYGPKQEGSDQPGGLLVFDVELISIK